MIIAHRISRRRNRHIHIPRLLEALEARTLLSAVIQVSGGGIPIANHDITPSLTDFTDFGPMSTTFNAAIGKVTRSFVIADTGSTDLALTGGLKLIRITGTNAADFVVTVTSSAAIPAGMQSSFTITFVPKTTGLRKAVVTIPSNDPAVPNLTFNIQGTALKTTNAVNGLQVATMTKGTGIGAISGSEMTVHYTGLLLNSVFETFQDPAGAPINFTLGLTQLIPGWQQGLVGIKAGETRLLVMPQQLGFDTVAHGNVPANSPLIFMITASALANPTVAVSGNAIPIAFGDKTPSVTDGTFIGATPAGSLVPLSFTFKIENGSAGKIVFPLSPVVILSSKTPANFSTTDITIDPTSTFATFTVTYTPTTVGTQTAIMHVRTSDPAHPDFTFTVSGTTTPFLDFSPLSIGTINYPLSGNVVSGASTKFKVPVTVTNLGNINVPGTTPAVHVDFYLHDLNSGTNVLISSQTTTNLRGTAPGKTKLVMMNVSIPGTVPAGSYQLLARINANGVPAESNLLNNDIMSSQMVTVTQGFFNVTGLLSTSTFPATNVAGAKLTGKLNVIVQNAGNLALPAGQKFTLQILAHLDGGGDTVIGTSSVTLSSWAPGKTASFSATTSLIAGLPAGHYEISALLTPVQLLTQSSTIDDRITVNGIGSDVELTVT